MPKKPDPKQCPGSGTKPARYWNFADGSSAATCPGCDQRRNVKDGVFTRHNKIRAGK